ncbi:MULTISPECIES: hypothetical protein [unclassified Pseudomonas]|uniref:hypothetical protein n=1 Tax=unclassified Pseudomonas TaxID=196821 RepID=UPI00384E2175
MSSHIPSCSGQCPLLADICQSLTYYLHRNIVGKRDIWQAINVTYTQKTRRRETRKRGDVLDQVLSFGQRLYHLDVMGRGIHPDDELKQIVALEQLSHWNPSSLKLDVLNAGFLVKVSVGVLTRQPAFEC